VPTYQYTCTDCGEPVEAVQKFTDEPLSVCAACGGRLRKVFSPVGIVFKGSGFYRTDSRNGSISAADAKKDKQDKQDKQSSESKPASDSNGSADKTAAKKSETVSTAAKSSSSEKVA
jgi:putative FmdB family regulatory protein